VADVESPDPVRIVSRLAATGGEAEEFAIGHGLC
jgi:hypothetical protein